jgi:hypothetical protein
MCPTRKVGRILLSWRLLLFLPPLFLALFCEFVRRRVVYVRVYRGFVLYFIRLTLGKNIATIFIIRIVLGLFGCVGTILVSGTFSDMWEPDSRAVPIAMFL